MVQDTCKDACTSTLKAMLLREGLNLHSTPYRGVLPEPTSKPPMQRLKAAEKFYTGNPRAQEGAGVYQTEKTKTALQPNANAKTVDNVQL